MLWPVVEHRRHLFLCAACGILSGISFWHANLSFLIWFTLAPFLHSAFDADFKTGLIRSYTFGIFFYLTAIFWLGNVTKAGLVVLVFYSALYPVLFYFLSRYFFDKPFMLFTLPSVWVLTEWLKEQVWCGFGWANLGYSQYLAKYFIQPVDLFGVKFISFLILLFNVFLLEVFLKRRHLVEKWAVVIFSVFFCFSYSHFRLKNLAAQDYAQVAIIQPNTAEGDKYRELTANQAVERMLHLGEQSAPNSLLIYPEAAWPIVVDENGRAVLKEFAARLDRAMIMGAVEEEGGFYNRAIFINDQNEVEGVYNKMKIVPFGEYVPLRSMLSFIPVINSLGDMLPGKEIKIFTYNQNQFGVLICFEDVFPVLAAKFARKSDFLINITNDEWFGGEPEASQHLAIMVFRAIENRISLARAANTGISAAVSFTGDINKFSLNKKETFVSGVLNVHLPLRNDRGLYTWFPEMWVIICGLFLAVWFFVLKFRVVKKGGAK